MCVHMCEDYARYMYTCGRTMIGVCVNLCEDYERYVYTCVRPMRSM